MPSISYFSMEYGIHNSLKTFSGGLGLLAGDYLKEASDYNIPMTGIGLLYRYGYFRQMISAGGEQVALNDAQDFSRLPITPVRDSQGNWKGSASYCRAEHCSPGYGKFRWDGSLSICWIPIMRPTMKVTGGLRIAFTVETMNIA